jgi:hypothetical protein
MIANSKPNKKYKPGSWRVVVDDNGVQRLALPDGTCLPAIQATWIEQNAHQALSGTCSVMFTIHEHNISHIGEWPATILINVVSEDNGAVLLRLCTYSCTAYLDTTEQQHADATQI